ncbi:hypothetical protein [Actinomycetospora cinnamomea]|uniref:DUF8010 domain-containing protein n=1 Tax=Actinomycetospora cinnamomea TaxID=663609 RepID=A0A2U1EY98_9PSEU|nr:hypothetical protein [Actinomycetospora cinnamomea]PVZ04903.1 hypothetical protein C8D89_1167 [Actinomycetospora cinnamomea]
MTLAVPGAADRAALADVVGRVVRLDAAAVVRLRDRGGRVVLWAGTPFDVLVTAAAPGSVMPADVTVPGSDLLAALGVVDAPEVDPGTAVDDRWRGDLPGEGPWRAVGAIPAGEVDAVVGRTGPAALDETAWEAGGVRVPARCLVAVAGMGWPEQAGALPVALADDGSWLRLEAGPASVHAAIVRRRRPRLALLT